MNRVEKISLAIEFIEDNLTEKLDLDTISKAVHYSKYYLHRMFSETVGITIHDYIQRRQLTESAKLLVFSERPIIEIALLSGYESQQAFTASFTAMYKMPPNKYRENEKFYPLQLRFDFGEGSGMADSGAEVWENVTFAQKDDIFCWMELVRLIVDGFPYLCEEEYVRVLEQKIEAKQALILKDGETAMGVMLFSHDTGSIDFMGSHPLCRKKKIPKILLDKVMGEMLKVREISITTYRQGDKADTGYREEIKGLGFSEAELLTEYGYPTQRFVMKKEIRSACREGGAK